MSEIVDRSAGASANFEAYKQATTGGFSFDNVARNATLNKTLGGSGDVALPSAWKTGTTIVGVVYKDGVVLGADTRATGGAEVVDKNCEKVSSQILFEAICQFALFSCHTHIFSSRIF